MISATVSAAISKKLIGKIGGKVISRKILPKNQRILIKSPRLKGIIARKVVNSRIETKLATFVGTIINLLSLEL